MEELETDFLRVNQIGTCLHGFIHELFLFIYIHEEWKKVMTDAQQKLLFTSQEGWSSE